MKADFLSMSLSSLLYSFYVIFMAHEAYRWYLAYPLIVAAFLLLHAVKEITLDKKISVIVQSYSVPIFVLILNCLVFYKYFEYQTVSSSLLDMTQQVNRIVPENSIIGTHDAGIVGYFSTSSVHNLDGLANSKYNLFQYLASGDIVGYVNRYKLDYLLLSEDRFMSLRLQNASNTNLSYSELGSYDVIRMAKVHLLKINH